MARGGFEIEPGFREMEQIISSLEHGTIITRFYPRKRPERRNLQVRRETRQLLWSRTSSNRNCGNYEGSIELREVKEIRFGKRHKDFDKWPEESDKIDHHDCFSIFYGSEFKLKVFNVAALSARECENWMKGVDYLVLDTVHSPFPLQVERWLRKEFYHIESRDVVSLKGLKQFLPRVNYKISTSRLLDYFREVDTRKRNEITFDEFTTLYQNIMYEDDIYQNLIRKYCDESDQITAKQMTRFLVECQGEQENNISETQVAQHMRKYLLDDQRNVPDPYFSVSEFMDFLFSRQNYIWDDVYDVVHQDMTRPLSDYWISSSHNTYLTGDQFSSESSVEAYTRCLRLGCRCIELDCWDGPDGAPIIYHGHTLTTRIKLSDVLYAIKEAAFSSSPYPLILSIEDNCSIEQQRAMAVMFQEVFGRMLLTQPIDRNESTLPSPEQLRYKIILKHKKLPDGPDEDFINMANDDVSDGDLRNPMKTGIMFLYDAIENKWNPYYFVLRQTDLFFTECRNSEAEEEPDVNDSENANSTNGVGSRYYSQPVSNDELHFGEEWYHGNLPIGRSQAEKLLQNNAHLGDGTFMVRKSETFVGDEILSFWCHKSPNHCRILCRSIDGKRKYWLIDTICFDSLYDLITHYRTHPLGNQDFEIKLTIPVPQPKEHEDQEWYHATLSRAQAEEYLKKIPYEGAFLVRPSDNKQNSYVISFRAERNVKHCRICVDGRLYVVGNMQFVSLVELIKYYQSNALFKKVKLSLEYPVSEEMAKRFQHVDINDIECAGYMYHPSPEVEAASANESNNELLGTLQRGSISVRGGAELVIKEIPMDEVSEVKYVLKIKNLEFKMGVTNFNEATEWENAISAIAQNVSVRDESLARDERDWKVAKEISKLIIYCRSVGFNASKWKGGNQVHHEMSSFSETKGEKLMCQQETALFLKYHKHQLSRIYPKGQRIDSSNYNPVPFWNCGSQMVALNWQTPDRCMQINQAKFMLNGSCGYLLKPACMSRDGFDPQDPNTLDIEGCTKRVSLTVIGARHLGRSSRGITSPMVEVEIIGADYDSGVKLKTAIIADNGLNPMWNESAEFEVKFPEIALIRFLVQDEDIFGEMKFIGQATFPLPGIRTGYRSVPLQNGFSEFLELSSLLVRINVKSSKDRYPNAFLLSGDSSWCKKFASPNELPSSLNQPPSSFY